MSPWTKAPARILVQGFIPESSSLSRTNIEGLEADRIASLVLAFPAMSREAYHQFLTLGAFWPILAFCKLNGYQSWEPSKTWGLVVYLSHLLIIDNREWLASRLRMQTWACLGFQTLFFERRPGKCSEFGSFQHEIISRKLKFFSCL